MITGITIENFKGIREPLRLDFRPITLLFGANSAGKSTILHALHYAREVFERHELSPNFTASGGSSVDVGGFRNFIHNQDINVPLRLSFDVSTEDWNDLDVSFDFPTINEFLGTGGMDCFALSSKVNILLEIRWSEELGRPYVAALTSTIDDTELIAVTSDPSGRRVELRINSEHPRLWNADNWQLNDSDLANEKLATAGDVPNASCLSTCLDVLRASHQTTDDGGFFLQETEDALLDITMHSDFPFVPRSSEADIANARDLLNGISLTAFVSEVNEGIGCFLWPALRDIHKFLTQFRYLGPLRELPSRHYISSAIPDDSKWASGRGAWDRLSFADDELVEDVSGWLFDEDRLNSGFQLRVKRFKELDMSDPLVIQLISGRAFDEVELGTKLDLTKIPTRSRVLIVSSDDSVELRPSDVGIGISQVVPVIVMALDGKRRLIAIEQPELHIHPRLQAAIGDLFVESIQKNGHRFIIETHSEHLILRLLRRIRETEKGKALPDRQLRTNDLAIYYLKQEDGCSVAQRIDVDVKGEFIQPWPDDFFEIDFFERFPDAR